MTDVTVVIPVLNEEKSLEQTLISLRQQTFKDFTLIVVDNGSTDRSIEIAQQYCDRVLFEQRLGPDLTRHRGFISADTELIASADADSVYPPDWLETLVKTLIKPDVVAVYGPMGYRESSLRRRKLEIRGYSILDKLSRIGGVPLAGAANFGCRRSAYIKVGGYPPLAHLASADFRLAKRLRGVGKVVFMPELVCYTSNRTLAVVGPFLAIPHVLKTWFDIALDLNRVPQAHYLALCKRKNTNNKQIFS